MPYLDPNDVPAWMKPMDDTKHKKFHQVIENKFEPHEVQEYLRTRLGNSAAVRQVGKDMQIMVNRWQSWAMAEIQSLRQEIEELQIEAEMDPIMPTWKLEWAKKNLSPKRWRNTNDESDPY